MFKKLYATTRSRVFDSSLTLEEISLQGGYTTIFFTEGQFMDFTRAGITKMSNPIPNNRFTATIPKIDRDENIIGSVPKLTRFMQIEYSDKFTDPVKLAQSIEKSGGDTSVIVFDTIEEARQFIRDDTDLVEESDGKFIIRDEYINEEGETVPTEYLIID